MNLEKAAEIVSERFPFEAYMISKGKIKPKYLRLASTVLDHLEPGDRILDFGCGPCDKTAILQLMGFNCYGYDDLEDYWHKIPGNRERILSFAREWGIDFRLATNRILPFDKGSFDMIMLHDILEHLHDSPRDLLNDLVELLKPGGLLFITLPNAANIRKRIQLLLGRTNLPPFEEYYWYPGPRRGHVREYVRDDLVQLLKYLDLETVELQGCDLRLQRLSAPLRYLFLVVTKIFPGWKDSWSLVARRGRDWTPRRALPRDQLESILGRRSAYHYSPYTNQ